MKEIVDEINPVLTGGEQWLTCPRCTHCFDTKVKRSTKDTLCPQCHLSFVWEDKGKYWYFRKTDYDRRGAYTPLNPTIARSWYTCADCGENHISNTVCPKTGRGYSLGLEPKTTAENTYANGATRSRDNDRPDYEAMLSPIAMETYAEYMFYCSFLPEGKRREEDNWQRGVPMTRWIKSLFRHVFTLHKIHRAPISITNEERERNEVALLFANCGVLFNAFGYLDALMKEHPDLLVLLRGMNKAKLAEQEKYNGAAKQG